jgi:O-antigen/teichoic acid export membrane protein
MVASHYVTETVIGQFSFAFSLANQASAILSYQLSTVLQPIFGRLKSDPVRQVAGFMRVVSLMSALAVPIALLQAALAEPLFLLVFGEKWLPAIPFFVAFSFGQAFYFMTAPAMALLKAQGRFGTFFVWQAAHAVACLALFPAAAMWWSAAGVAWADAALWLVSVPLAVSLGARTVGMRLPAVLKVLFASWLTAGPIALAAWAAWRFMPGTPTVAALVALLGVGPVALLLSILAVRITQPAVAGEIAPFMRRVFTRVPVLGTPLANWFAPGEP